MCSILTQVSQRPYCINTSDLTFSADLPGPVWDEFHIIDAAVTSFINSIPPLENASDFARQRSPESTRLLMAYLKTQAHAASAVLNSVSPERGSSREKFRIGVDKVVEIVRELNDDDLTWMIPLAVGLRTSTPLIKLAFDWDIFIVGVGHHREGSQ